MNEKEILEIIFDAFPPDTKHSVDFYAGNNPPKLYIKVDGDNEECWEIQAKPHVHPKELLP